MDKFLTLCWDCRQTMQEAYTLKEADTQKLAKKKCDNCGGTFFLRYCQIKSKGKEDL
jgi:hypothetical protein